MRSFAPAMGICHLETNKQRSNAARADPRERRERQVPTSWGTVPSRRDGSRSGGSLGEARQGGRGRRGRGPSRAEEGGGRSFVGEGEKGEEQRARKGRVVDLVREAGGQEREALEAPASRALAENPGRERPAERPARPRDDLQVLQREAEGPREEVGDGREHILPPQAAGEREDGVAQLGLVSLGLRHLGDPTGP